MEVGRITVLMNMDFNVKVKKERCFTEEGKFLAVRARRQWELRARRHVPGDRPEVRAGGELSLARRPYLSPARPLLEVRPYLLS